MQAATERPRLRQDLLAEQVDEHGAKYIDVMDPDSGGVFRFYEVEFSIACAMDGERDVPGLVRWAQEELGVTPTATEVQSVIATLGELGYLDMAGAAKAAAADVPASPARAAAGLAAAGVAARDTLVDSPSMSMPPGRTATPPAPGTSSEVSLDLSQHLAVGKEDVQEAVRQSKVMAAVDVPPELLEAMTAPPPVEVKQPERPVARPPERAASRPPSPPEAKQPERAVEVKQPERPVAPPVEAKQPERAVEVKQPERPVAPPVEAKQPERPIERPLEVKQPERPVERPVEVKQPERPVEVKQPVTLPKVPEKQPVVPTAPASRVSPVLIVLLVLVLLGGAGFLVWKFVLNKPAEQPPVAPVGTAPVTPQPVTPEQPPPGPPPKPTVTTKVEVSSGETKTILAYFGGTIEWIETANKEVKSNDVIMKLVGNKALEAEIAKLKKETDKLQTDLDAAYKVRDNVAAGDEAALKKAQAKVEAAEKAYNTKADLLQKKSDEIEKFLVRLTIDGTLATVTRKVGEKIPDNTPIATIVPAPIAAATFTIPRTMKLDVGMATVLKQGDRILTCEVADWQPEQLRIACPQEKSFVEGATVSWELP